MKKSIIAIGLGVSLVFGGATACSKSEPLRNCTVYEDEVLDLDDEGQCYAPNDDKKKTKKTTSKKKSFGTTKKSSSTKSSTRKK